MGLIFRRLKNIKDYEEAEARLDALKLLLRSECFSPQVVTKLKQPFQLVEYQTNVQLCQEELQAAASKTFVIIYPGGWQLSVIFF